jgi:hypothetical protein
MVMVSRSSTDRRASSRGHSFLLVRCRRGERRPVAFTLKSLTKAELIEHVSGPYDIVAQLPSTSDNDLDWFGDLPGVESIVRLEATA